MEVPIILATDTTENWNRSDTALGAGELAIELAGVRADGSPVKHLLVGDGKPTGPNVARLRATPEIIAGLPQALQNLAANTATEGGAWRQAVAVEASTRENADRALQESIDSQVAGERGAREATIQSEAASRESADQALQESIDSQVAGEREARENADRALQESIDSQVAGEREAREDADRALQESIDSQVAGEREARKYAVKAEAGERERAVQKLDAVKIDKAVAGDKGTFVQSVGVKEIASDSFIAAYANANVETGAVTETQFELPQASEKESGIMPAESFRQISDNTRRIATLEGRGLIFMVDLATETPSQAELQAAFEAASGIAGAPPDQTTLKDRAHDKRYTFFTTRAEWVDMGRGEIASFTNDTHGLIRGDNVSGKVFAESDGTGRVVGWADLKTRVANNEASIGQALSELEGLIPDEGLPVSKGGTGAIAAETARTNLGAASTSPATSVENGLMSAGDKTKLDGVSPGAQVNPGNATQSLPGLMSAADKVKLDGISHGAQVNPGGATQAAGGGGAVAALFSEDLANIPDNNLFFASLTNGFAQTGHSHFPGIRDRIRSGLAPIADPSFTGNARVNSSPIAGVNTQTANNVTNLPIGSHILAVSSTGSSAFPGRNEAIVPNLWGVNQHIWQSQIGTVLTGTWRSCGVTPQFLLTTAPALQFVVLLRRVA